MVVDIKPTLTVLVKILRKKTSLQLLKAIEKLFLPIFYQRRSRVSLAGWWTSTAQYFTWNRLVS